MRRIAILLCLCLLGSSALWGCSSGPRADASMAISDQQVLDGVPVCQIIGPTSGGTGIPLGNNLILTARHVIKDRFLQVNGRWTGYRIIASGEGPNEDWIIIRCAAAPAKSNVELAPDYRPRPGEPVFFLGYWQGGAKQPVEMEAARRLPVCIVRGTATATPMSFTLPTDGLLFAAAPLRGESYYGVSGGPVAVYDRESETFRVVGVYKGSWEVIMLGLSRTLHTAVFLPAQAIADAIAQNPDPIIEEPRRRRR
jgi:hypothetical protein